MKSSFSTTYADDVTHFNMTLVHSPQ